MKVVKTHEKLIKMKKAAVFSSIYTRDWAFLGLDKAAPMKNTCSEANFVGDAKYATLHYLATWTQTQTLFKWSWEHETVSHAGSAVLAQQKLKN